MIEKSVFISRDLSPNSPFRHQLEAVDFSVTGQSLLNFKPVFFESYSTTDWIFFYSRKAVKYFFTQIEKLPTDIKIAAYGRGTAEALTKHNITPDFIGTGEGKSTLTAFLKLAKKVSVLFPQARQSRQTIEKLAGDKLIKFSLIVYDNEPLMQVKKSSATFLVFTSPLNVAAYFTHHKLGDRQRVVVIGETTGIALDDYGIKDFIIASTPSEEGLAAAILSQI